MRKEPIDWVEYPDGTMEADDSTSWETSGYTITINYQYPDHKLPWKQTLKKNNSTREIDWFRTRTEAVQDAEKYFGYIFESAAKRERRRT